MPTVYEDRDEILQLLYRYNHAVDGADAEAWADTFTPDGVLDAGGRVMSGRDEFVAFAKTVSGIRHMVVNPIVEVSGDSAHVRAYLMVLRGGAIGSVGIYDDQVVRTDDGWRFIKRVFTPDAPRQ
jgi:uncharacterized protein (TIGR02246 family)